MTQVETYRQSAAIHVKARRVLESCRTPEQYQAGLRYVQLAKEWHRKRGMEMEMEEL